MTTKPKGPAEATDQDVVQDVVQALQGMQSGDRVYLSRKSPDTLKYGHLGPVDTGEDPFEFLEIVKRRWGGGDYRASRYGTREDGTRGHIAGASVYFSIEGPPKYAPDPAAAPREDTASKLESVVAGLVETIRQDRQSRSDDLFRMMFESNARLMETVAARPAPEGADAASLLEVFRQGMDLGREAAEAAGGGGSGEADPYEGVAARLMDMVAGLQGGGAPAALPEHAQAPPTGSDAMDDPPGAAALALAPHLGGLLQAARARIPAPQVAAAVLGGVEDPDAVRLVLVDPTVIDDVIAMDPRFARWRSWLHDVLAELDALYSEGEDDDGEGDGPGGVAPADGGSPDSRGNGSVPG